MFQKMLQVGCGSVEYLGTNITSISNPNNYKQYIFVSTAFSNSIEPNVLISRLKIKADGITNATVEDMGENSKKGVASGIIGATVIQKIIPNGSGNTISITIDITDFTFLLGVK